MKKKIFGGILVIALAAVAAFNVNINSDNNGFSLLNLANVEALAQEGTEPEPIKWLKMTYTCKKKDGTSTSNKKVTCSSGGTATSCTTSDCPSGESPWY